MKLIKIFLVPAFILPLIFSAFGQTTSIIGSWQLVRESNCLEESADLKTDSLADLRDDMKSRAGATGQVIRFKENFTGEESTRILTKIRAANVKKFYYKFNGEMLLILDKKTQTISDSYLVDKFTPDSLILSNASRPCETKMFVKISESAAN
jgi:hypothetical protein